METKMELKVELILNLPGEQKTRLLSVTVALYLLGVLTSFANLKDDNMLVLYSQLVSAAPEWSKKSIIAGLRSIKSLLACHNL